LYDKKFQFFFSLFPKKKKKKNETARADIKNLLLLPALSRASDISLSLSFFLQVTKEFAVSRLFFA